MFWNGWFQAEAGSLNEAETAYRRVISTAKAKEDDWALYWARLGVGDIRLSRGDLSAAIAAYQAASEMADRLAKADPDKSDLPVAYFKVGDVLMAQGNLAEALTSYRKGLAIIERLAKADPDNTGWQRDLVASYGRVGSVLAQQGEKILARDTFYRGRAIAAQLKDQFADDAQLPKRLTAFDAEIAKLEQAQAAEPRNCATGTSSPVTQADSFEVSFKIISDLAGATVSSTLLQARCRQGSAPSDKPISRMAEPTVWIGDISSISFDGRVVCKEGHRFCEYYRRGYDRRDLTALNAAIVSRVRRVLPRVAN